MKEYLPLRVRAKLLLRKLLPKSLFSAVHAIWAHTFAHFVKGQDILKHYTAIFLSQNPRAVQAGPFKSMQYVDMAVGSSYFHKLVGSYEAVLHPTIERIRGKKFDTVLDIGSAEGYYLIGFGRFYKDAHLVGFEIEEKGRQLTEEMYTMNHLTNKLTLLGEATAKNITPYITNHTLLVCDCEGGELDILDPVTSPELLTVDMAIIELHDFIRPGIQESLTNRFKATHSVTIVPFVLADPKDFPFLASVSNKKDLYELRRERGWQEQNWMILEKK
jgi:hypothetical protein